MSLPQSGPAHPQSAEAGKKNIQRSASVASHAEVKREIKSPAHIFTHFFDLLVSSCAVTFPENSTGVQETHLLSPLFVASC